MPPAPPTPVQISYIDPDGAFWNLSDLSMSNGYVCSAIAGIDGFPIMIQTIPLLDGTAIPNIYIPQPGTIPLSILVGPPASGLENDYYTLLDRIVRAFYHRRNELPAPGTLIIQRPNGSQRQITVYTTSGLDTPDVGKNNMMVYTFTLQTPDPYWSDLTPNNLIFSLNNAAGILPVLPISLGGGTILGTATVNNPGNALAYPTWQITGPGQPTIQNLTSGRQWSLNTPIPAGHIVNVVTKPGQQMAYDVTAGVSVWDQLVFSSLRDLWPFLSGNNIINIAMAGATPATAVSLTWTNRWNRA